VVVSGCKKENPDRPEGSADGAGISGSAGGADTLFKKLNPLFMVEDSTGVSEEALLLLEAAVVVAVVFKKENPLEGAAASCSSSFDPPPFISNPPNIFLI
jgi:hypothetical protein